MKAYLIGASRTYINGPEYLDVCIDRKLHMTYERMSLDAILNGRSEDIRISDCWPCFRPCNGEYCINSLFRHHDFTKNHQPTPSVLEFLHNVLKKESREEIPSQYVPFVERVLSGEDPRKVGEEMLKIQKRRW